MNKNVLIGIAVVLATIGIVIYRAKESERKQAYKAMATEVGLALKEMKPEGQTQEQIQKRAGSFASAATLFSEKVRRRDRDVLDKIQEAQGHLKAAIDAFPPPMTEKEKQDQIQEMMSQMKVSLDTTDSSHLMYKVDGITLGGGKRQEGLIKAAEELKSFLDLCKEIAPRLETP
jgi:hypothetical protein